MFWRDSAETIQSSLDLVDPFCELLLLVAQPLCEAVGPMSLQSTSADACGFRRQFTALDIVYSTADVSAVLKPCKRRTAQS